MKQLLSRLFSDVPAFFRRMQIFGTSLAALGISLGEIPSVPANIAHDGSILIWVGGTIVAVSQCAIKNTDTTIQPK